MEFKAEDDASGEKASGMWGVGHHEMAFAVTGKQWFWFDTLNGTAAIEIFAKGTLVFKGSCTHSGTGEQNPKYVCPTITVYKDSGSPRLADDGIPTYVYY
jgi:hypothetical protein